MNRIVASAVLSLLVACSGSSTPAATPAPSPELTPAPEPTPAPAAIDPAKLGSPCDQGACPAPATCVSYYGIAGPRGPQFSSCEITCADDKGGCPGGTTCVTIADGPGAVCRPGE
ncbi:MAG: hypothetical protein JWP01_2960 [Myxococcales bacterium]|nr:hypothetical protein [Myxococcales bacterium]